MKTKVVVSVGAVAMAFALLVSCSNSKPVTETNPFLKSNIAVPNVTAGTNFGFDISSVNGSNYSLTDRNNKALDVVAISTLTLAQVQGSGATAFAGVQPPPPAAANNGLSGPDGNNPVGALQYVGDVNSVKVVDPVAKTIVQVITQPRSTGFRMDEGCLDSTHNIFMISSPEETPPFATFINTTTRTIVATVTFNDGAGLENCQYDAGQDAFFVNNDGITTAGAANAHGELDKLPGAAIRAIPAGGTVDYSTLTGLARYGEGNCDPTGLALGPGNDIAVGCREGTTGAPLLFLIFDRTSGTLQASLNAGGGDQVWYDPTTNAYYNAASRWTATGLAGTGGACSSTSLCTPVLFVIDAAARKILGSAATGNNSHSVAVDPVTGNIFVPYSSATAPGGCGTCTANGFINGGISVFNVGSVTFP